MSHRSKPEVAPPRLTVSVHRCAHPHSRRVERIQSCQFSRCATIALPIAPRQMQSGSACAAALARAHCDAYRWPPPHHALSIPRARQTRAQSPPPCAKVACPMHHATSRRALLDMAQSSPPSCAKSVRLRRRYTRAQAAFDVPRTATAIAHRARFRSSTSSASLSPPPIRRSPKANTPSHLHQFSSRVLAQAYRPPRRFA